MSYLREIAPQNASGRLAEIYATFERELGFIPKAFRMASVSPELLAQHWDYLRYYLDHPTLSRRLTAAIRLLVSQLKGCDYCIGLNRGILLQQGVSPGELRAMERDPAQAPLNEKEKALLLFTLKGVRDPHAVIEADLDALRRLGWTDSEIFDALHHGARQVAFDILIDAFGVEPEH